MTPHTTHHDDCGCLSDRYEARVLGGDVNDYEADPVTIKLRAEVRILARALLDCETYFDERADVDGDDEGGGIGNAEAHLLGMVRRALGKEGI